MSLKICVKVHLVNEIVHQFSIEQSGTKGYHFCKVEYGVTNPRKKIEHAVKMTAAKIVKIS